MRPSWLLLAFFIGSPLGAQNRPSSCSAPEHHQFDYWLGEWVVTDSAGATTYGTNSITSGEAGCLLHEHWRGRPSGSGQSFNFYDRSAGRWEQVWVASNGNVLHLTGQLQANTMVLEGETRTPQGVRVLNRIAWIPQPDGRVRQRWSTSSDDGKTWQVGFDGWYRRTAP